MSTPAPSIESVPLAMLREEYVRQSKAKIEAVRLSNVILAELERRLANNLQTSLLTDKGKSHGEATDTVDGLKVRVGVKQMVSWDTEKLKSVYASLDPEIAEKVFKVAVSVPEKTFNAITDLKLNEALIAARTIRLSKPYVEFVFEEGEIA